jgi:hypothetical protein
MEQALQDRKAAKKKAEEERIAKLSATEQRKVRVHFRCVVSFETYNFFCQF